MYPDVSCIFRVLYRIQKKKSVNTHNQLTRFTIFREPLRMVKKLSFEIATRVCGHIWAGYVCDMTIKQLCVSNYDIVLCNQGRISACEKRNTRKQIISCIRFC